MSDIVVVRTYTYDAEARIAAAALEAHGIDSLVLADNAGGAMPSMSFVFPIRLMVHRSEAELAQKILDGIAEPEDSPED